MQARIKENLISSTGITTGLTLATFKPRCFICTLKAESSEYLSSMLMFFLSKIFIKPKQKSSRYDPKENNNRNNFPVKEGREAMVK
jgi:hypothetical protein